VHPSATGSSCAGERIAESQISPGYRLVGVRQINGNCFAMLESTDASLTPLSPLDGGTADVRDTRGHLIRRFTATALPNGEWVLLEYQRLLIQKP
jgi:hypothetical protein